MSIATELNTVYTSLLYNLVNINESLENRGGNAADSISDIAGCIDNLPSESILANAIIDNTVQSVNSAVSIIGAYKFYQSVNLATAHFQNVKTIGEKAFYGCINMSDFSAPLTEYIGAQAFSESGIVNADFPVLTEIKNGAFIGCYDLVDVTMPRIEVIEVSTFVNSTALDTADFTDLKIINRSAFEGCSNLSSLILRGNTVVALRDANAFLDTPIRSGAGYIYVPMNLVSAYKAATNWTVFSGKIRAIENYPEII